MRRAIKLDRTPKHFYEYSIALLRNCQSWSLIYSYSNQACRPGDRRNHGRWEMSASDLGGASSPQGGMEFTWPSEVSIEDILAAAERRARYLAGEEIPGRRKRKSRGSGRRTGVPGDAVPPSADTGPADSVGGAPLFDPAADDPQGEDAVDAAMSGAGSSVSLADLAGHALIDPGPALAGWLSCAPSADLDDAGLVT